MMNTSKTETTKTSIQKPSFSYRKPPFSYSLQKKGGKNYIYTFDFKIGNGLEKKLRQLFQLKKKELLKSVSKFVDLTTIVKKVKNYLAAMLPKHHLKENKGIHRALRYFGYHLVGLKQLYPLFLDDYVHEIYIDNLYKPIYIDHQKGRLKTKIKLSKTQISRFVNLLRVNCDSLISPESPSSKVDLVSEAFQLRVVVDAPPLVPNYTFNIRKLKNRPLEPSFFIYSDRHFDFLTVIILTMALRGNVLIAGEPASGKTTLLSTIIKLLPRYWRIVIIEGVKEFPSYEKKHCIRINVDPFEKTIKNRTKQKEITKLLQKTPDTVVLSEIMSSRDIRTLFKAISMGLHVAGTLHGRDLRTLIDRFRESCDISGGGMKNLDVIVLMRRTITSSSVRREIAKIFLVGGKKIKNLFASFRDTISSFSAANFLELTDLNFNNEKQSPIPFSRVVKFLCSKVPTQHISQEKCCSLVSLGEQLHSRLGKDEDLTPLTEKMYDTIS